MDDCLCCTEQEDLELEIMGLRELLTEVRASHWELVQQLGHAHYQIEELSSEIRIMERQIDRRTRS